MNLRHDYFPALVGGLFFAGLMGAGWLAISTTTDDPIPADNYSVYDHPDVYWVFQHRDEICANAQKLLDDNDSTLRDVIDANVVTFDESGDVTSEEAQQYLRGLLTGCINY